jgi:hypothetical protein
LLWKRGYGWIECLDRYRGSQEFRPFLQQYRVGNHYDLRVQLLLRGLDGQIRPDTCRLPWSEGDANDFVLCHFRFYIL